MAGQERVGILIELEDPDQALKTLREIDDTIRDIGRKKTMIKLDDGSLVAIDDRIKEIQDKLAAVRSSKGGEILDHGEVKTAKDLNNELRILKQGLRDGTREAKTFSQTFNSISSKVAHIGSAMQSFGNALTTLTSPFSRITNGILMGVGFKAVDSFTEGFEKGFSRYDTMKKFPKIMASFGFGEAEADASIKALDKSVRGLPTGLDEMVDLTQRFTATVGDLDKGTKLAIATNNAFLASMSTDTQRYQGMMQLQDVLGGKDMNAREWNSLVSSMTPAIVKMGEAMKESGEWSGSIGDFIQYVRDGKMDNQKFINQLIAIGNKGGALEKMAQESKDTWQAFFANVGNASSRMTAGIIQAFDEISRQVTGKDVNQLFADTIIPAIDNATESIKGWIQAHPEEITQFFRDLKQIDIGSFLKGFANGMGDMLKIAQGFVKLAGGKGLGALGWIFGSGRTIGRAFTVIGGLLKGTRHIWAGLLTPLVRAGSGKVGIFGKIASLFGRKKDITTAETTAKTIPTVADTFKGAFSALQGLIQAAGAVLIVSGTGFVAFKAAKSILKDLKEMTDIVNGGGWDNVGYVASGIIVAIGGFTEIFNAIGTMLGPQGLLATAIAGAASFIVAGSFAADMWAIKQGVIQIRDTIAELDNVATGIQNFKGIGTLGAGVKQKFSDSIAAINEIKNMFVGKSGSKMDRGQVEAGLPTFSVGKVTSLTNVANALKQMQKIATQLSTLSTVTVNDPTATVNAIKKALDSLQGVRAPKGIDGHAKAAANALYQMRRMAYSINKLAGTDVNSGGFASFIAQLKTALESLKGLQGELELDIAVKLSPNFGKSVNTVIKYINKAKQNIKNSTNKAVVFTIPVKVTFSLSTNFADALAGITSRKALLRNAASSPVTYGPPAPKATGGMVYRAGGGRIPWKRRGTDTVPAMLTPGEYVHNKRAVNTFGIDFMRKVNNLDVKGAMNELMHRAGNMANVNRGSVVNNTYNNNQKVIINNNNAGADFTFKRASRFVGAI